MAKLSKLHQINLFGELEPPTISVEGAAVHLGVSTATIRNWIKAKYLHQARAGKISLESIDQFQKEISGKYKLHNRANKSLKDSHDHEEIISRFINQISSSPDLIDEIASQYETALSESYRNKEGIYYTPNDVIKDLFDLPVSATQHSTFCDPCCGSGNFVIHALKLGFKPENIYGYDTDLVAVEITKTRIYKTTGYKSGNIKLANFLDIASKEKSTKFDYIYTNPPWGKKVNRALRESIGIKLEAGASLDTCSLFFFACLRCLKSSGGLGLLLPESFFNVSSFESARTKALQLSIKRLIDYGKPFKGLISKAHGIVLTNEHAKSYSTVFCQAINSDYHRSINSFLCNPKSIFNLYCDDEDANTLRFLLSIPHITLNGQASWGLGIVTGNNKKFIKPKSDIDYIPVYRGADITPQGLAKCSCYIPADMSLYQQVAPLKFYQAREKLAYKFISSKLCFFYDDKQSYFLNSANILIPKSTFPVSNKLLSDLLSSDFMNWIFMRIFNTHKILRGDIESLPIYSQFLDGMSIFNEQSYLNNLKIKRVENGTYRIKE